MLRPLLAASLVCATLTACTSPASLAAGIVNSLSSENPYWNWSMTDMVKATDCDRDGMLTLTEINRCWQASDDDYASQPRPFTAAEYDRALATVRSPGSQTAVAPQALMQALVRFPRNYQFIGPCR
jgi:hypothetical protein